jgi:hypothetical protein
MPAEAVPVSTQSDGRWRITNVPIGSNAKSVAILNGATAKPITYGITGDGWQPSIDQATVEDKRLTLIQNLSRPGKVTESYQVTVVESATVDSADLVLTGLSKSGAESQFVVRSAVANDAVHAVAQLADIITGVVGVRRRNPPTENGVDTATFGIYPTKVTENQVPLVA